MEPGQYQAYADELFGVAADALLAPPMQVPQILVSWEPPPVCGVCEPTVMVAGDGDGEA